MINQDAIAAKTVVGTVTAGSGLATYFEMISSALGIVATILGIILTSWIIYKEIRAEKERRAAKAGKLKRRATDVDDG